MLVKISKMLKRTILLLLKCINVFLEKKKKIILTYGFATMMNHSIACFSFEPSLQQICQWFCQIGLHIFMVNRISVDRFVNLHL